MAPLGAITIPALQDPVLNTIRLTGEKNVAGHYGQIPRAEA
jgi:hypothetical protein